MDSRPLYSQLARTNSTKDEEIDWMDIDTEWCDYSGGEVDMDCSPRVDIQSPTAFQDENWIHGGNCSTLEHVISLSHSVRTTKARSKAFAMLALLQSVKPWFRSATLITVKEKVIWNLVKGDIHRLISCMEMEDALLHLQETYCCYQIAQEICKFLSVDDELRLKVDLRICLLKMEMITMDKESPGDQSLLHEIHDLQEELSYVNLLEDGGSAEDNFFDFINGLRND